MRSANSESTVCQIETMIPKSMSYLAPFSIKSCYKIQYQRYSLEPTPAHSILRNSAVFLVFQAFREPYCKCLRRVDDVASRQLYECLLKEQRSRSTTLTQRTPDVQIAEVQAVSSGNEEAVGLDSGSRDPDSQPARDCALLNTRSAQPQHS
jgi:hypothetical protein